jgi:hypothetical protein
VATKNYLDVEDLEVYKKLCRLHIKVCDLTHTWPREEKYELGSQVRRWSNSSPAQLAEKNDDRHIRNKIENSVISGTHFPLASNVILNCYQLLRFRILTPET